MPQVASIYIGDPSLISGKLLLGLEDVSEVKIAFQGDKKIGFLLKTTWGTVRGTFVKEQDLPKKLLDLEGGVNENVKDDAALMYTLERLYHVQLGIQLSIVHKEADELAVQYFLLRLNNELKSVMHIYKWLWDWDTERLAKING